MRVLFDQGTPVPLRKHLAAHQIVTTFELGWNNLKNGELLQKAEENGFSVLSPTTGIFDISRISWAARSQLLC